MRKVYLSLLGCFAFVSVAATVHGQGMAVNNTGSAADASAMLDVSSTQQGLLVPRMTAANRTSITSPATGLLVYQTDGTKGFYYNAGTSGAPSWVNLGVANAVSGVTINSSGTVTVTDNAGSATSTDGAWKTNGNSGMATGTNFVGTTSSAAFSVKTNGSASTNERMRFLTTPQVVVNATTVQSGDLVSIYGGGYAGATNTVANQTDFPLNAYSTGANAGVYGENTGTGQGLLGINTSTGAGVWGDNGNAAGIGVVGRNTAAGTGVVGTSTSGYGVNGLANGALVQGIRGFNQNATGTGIIALGNNISAGTVNPAGSGLAANGTAAGVFAIGTNASTGIGVMGGGTNVTTITTTGQGEGVVGNGNFFGVSGFCTAATLTNDKWGAYFDYLSSAGGWAYVAGRTAGTDYGIYSGGAKLTAVKDKNGKNRIMYCTEAPECLFQDFGEANLINGRAHVDMDPLFTLNIAANKPIRVLIQPEGDCKGVYVTNKTSSGFDVIELNGGTSNITFTWQITGNRANTYDAKGNLTNGYAELRFPVGPDRVEPHRVQAAAAPAPQSEQLQIPKKTADKKEPQQQNQK